MIEWRRLLLCGGTFVGLTVVIEIGRWLGGWLALLCDYGRGNLNFVTSSSSCRAVTRARPWVCSASTG